MERSIKDKPKTIDDYLATLDEAKRDALQTLRRQILAAAPDVEECISYGLLAFRQNRIICGFGGTSKHCAFYMFNDTTLDTFDGDLSGYDVSKGTLRFQSDKPLPAVLVHKLVRVRLIENANASKKN